jgi:multidrug efflux pump subunit AcrA (membrane-fusion protein)
MKTDLAAQSPPPQAHSGHMDNIIGRPPAWIIRRGNTVIASLICFLAVGTWLIKYPDVVTAPVIISAMPPPIKLVARSAGHILMEMVVDQQEVKKNQIIAVIENPAVTVDLLRLKSICEKLDTAADLADVSSRIFLPANIQAGEMQADFASLDEAFNKFQYFSLQHDPVAGHGASHKIKITNEEKDILLKIRYTVKKIRGEIAVWEDRYVICSPVDGKLVFLGNRKDNKYVNENEPVFVVIPKFNDYLVQVQVPASEIGKIKPGQSALIKLYSYPYQEYGILEAKVENVTTILLDTTYSIKLQLIRGFTTTTHHLIAPGPESAGIAEIVTDNKSILKRVFKNIF